MPEVFAKNDNDELTLVAGSTKVTREENRRGDRSKVEGEPRVASEEDINGEAIVLDQDLEAEPAEEPTSAPKPRKSASKSSSDEE